MKPVILIGGYGHCHSVIDVAECCGREIRGILNLPDLVGTEILGYPVIGTDEDIKKYCADCEFVITLGSVKDATARISLHKKVIEAGGTLATIVSPDAHVSRYADVGAGSVVLHHANVNACVRVGIGGIINTASNIEHDVTIGDYCHVSTGAMVNGGVSIGDGCFIGSGAVIANGISIVSGCVIAAGATVVKDITEPGIYAGVPAKQILK